MTVGGGAVRFPIEAGGALKDVIIKNSDSIAHNIHALPKKSQEFNFAQTKQGEEAKKSFASPEIVKVKCDIHGWMGCVVGVFNHPFFAVTKEDGTFEIKGLPAGTYTIELWHEQLGTQTQSVTVDGQTPAKVSAANCPAEKANGPPDTISSRRRWTPPSSTSVSRTST